MRWQLLGQTFHCPAWWKASTHALLTSGVKAPPAFLSLPLVLQADKGNCLHRTGPQYWDAQSVAQSAHSTGWVSAYAISLFLLVPLWGHRFQLHAFLPDYLGIFLEALFAKEFSTCFQLAFHENCSTCRYIFDVSVGGGKFHILFYTILILLPNVAFETNVKRLFFFKR